MARYIVIVSRRGLGAARTYGPVEAKDAEDAAGQAVEDFGGDRSKLQEDTPEDGMRVYRYGNTHRLAVERLTP